MTSRTNSGPIQYIKLLHVTCMHLLMCADIGSVRQSLSKKRLFRLPVHKKRGDAVKQQLQGKTAEETERKATELREEKRKAEGVAI